jgi:hypothetical protein
MPAYELVNLKTKFITLLPLNAILNEDLKALAQTLDLWQSSTRGIIQLTRIY